MPAYRFEIARQGRAVCKNAECKKENIKIAKGELRFGTFVTTDKFESWSWKHWGCTTPAQIDHLLNAIGGFEAFKADPNVLDGYEEVDGDSQEKIRNALRDGHVSDQDWRGDPELNRAGAKGMRKRTSKKKGVDEIKSDEESEVEATLSKAKSVGKKQPKTVDANEEAPSASAALEKKTARKRKAPTEDAEAAPEANAAPAARGRKVKKQATAEEEPAPQETLPKKKHGKKTAKDHDQPNVASAAVVDDMNAKAQPPKKTGTKKQKPKTKEVEAEQVPVRAKKQAAPATEAAGPKTKASRGRPKKAAGNGQGAEAEATMNGESEPEPEPDTEKDQPAAARRRGRKKATKA